MDLLERVWAASDALFDEDVTEARALHVPIALRQPFVFYLGHLPSFAANKLLLVTHTETEWNEHPYDALFSRGIDPDVDDPSTCHDHPPTPPTWPSWADVRSYRDAVRAAVRSLFRQPSKAPPPHPATVRMVAEHEVMHIETLQYMLAQARRRRRPLHNSCAGHRPCLSLKRKEEEEEEEGKVEDDNEQVKDSIQGSDASNSPSPLLSSSSRSDERERQCLSDVDHENNNNNEEEEEEEEGENSIEWITIDQGTVTTGIDISKISEYGTPFVWDNETDTTPIHVPAFRVMRYAVTVGDMARFVRGGGYRDARWWTAEDWAWVTNSCPKIRHPQTWECTRVGGEDECEKKWRWSEFVVLTAAQPGTSVCEGADLPASVSLAEARAYARWRSHIDSEGGGRGRVQAYRVMNECEWVLAAGGDRGANGGFGELKKEHKQVSSVYDEINVSRDGVVNLVGNGWELTQSPFQAHEGFVPTAQYPEYSTDFFDGKHYVLRGASWATDPIVIRRSFRNFYQARYAYVFSKFRLVSAVE